MLTDIATGQRERGSRGQLLAAGFTPRMLVTATARGELHHDFRGVFIVGGDVDIPLGRETSALLTFPGLCLTGLSVLTAMGILAPAPKRPVDVAGPNGRCGSRPGIRVHRYGDLTAADVRIFNGLPMTTVERALLDVADELSGAELERVVDEALAKRLTSRTKIRDTAEPAIGRRGRRELLMLVEARRPSIEAKLRAERTALALIRQAGLPIPQTHVELFGFEADMYFADAGLVLEIDSLGWHGVIRYNFNRDRRRDRVHRQNGLEVVRVTADELTGTPLIFISDLSAAIARRRATRATWVA